jgi:hypothetical protein
LKELVETGDSIEHAPDAPRPSSSTAKKYNRQYPGLFEFNSTNYYRQVLHVGQLRQKLFHSRAQRLRLPAGLEIIEDENSSPGQSREIFQDGLDGFTFEPKISCDEGH